MVSSTLFWSSLFSLALAKRLTTPMVLQDSRSEVPLGFSRRGAAPSDQSLTLRIALASNNITGLEKVLLDISTPSSPNYGKYLTKDEVNAYIAPSTEALTAVHQWFSSTNITTVSGTAVDWLTVAVPISTANRLMAANYETFLHLDSGTEYARTLSYSLPASVAPYIDHIHPSTGFTTPLRPTVATFKSVSPTVKDSCEHTITPECLQRLYGIPSTAAKQPNNRIAVAGFIEQFANKEDMKTFLETFRTDMSSDTTFATEKLDDGQNPQELSLAGAEANLDVQYTVGIATGVPVTFVSVGNRSQNHDGLGGFLDIVNFFLDQDDIPQVMTTSYGQEEADLSRSMAFKLCQAYMALGARGVSVLFASGDGGVEGGGARKCKKFGVAFPAGCPYLTAVGSTHGISPETGSDFSSGGFSNFFEAPDYQKDAVAKYFDLIGSDNAGLFNASGRGYPDVSAQGENVQIVVGGKTVKIGGTSCSSPIFASVIGLLNDQLSAAGKPPLGFLNPWLYANAGALNDISTGSNPGPSDGGGTPGCGTDGFAAKKGWDPVTGLGTPNFEKMKAAAGL
ncbi:family S53 protease [Mycena rebaudengoi]|nr:family S53 protease [Mycena rebaudengoi]